MRARRTLGVILYGEGLFTFYPYTFNGLVIEIYVRHFNVAGFFDSLRIYAKTMVLGCDLAFSCKQVFDGMI